MKIYKSNLQALIEEARPPFYLSYFRTSVTEGQVPMESITVSVAAFNPEGQVCELVIVGGPVWIHDLERRKTIIDQADQNKEEILKRLHALALEVRDGRISETPVWGQLD